MRIACTCLEPLTTRYSSAFVVDPCILSFLVSGSGPSQHPTFRPTMNDSNSPQQVTESPVNLTGSTRQDEVALPESSAKRKIGLILLSMVASQLALYLDGASKFNIIANLAISLLARWYTAHPRAVIDILRPPAKRKTSTQTRRSLKRRFAVGCGRYSRLYRVVTLDA